MTFAVLAGFLMICSAPVCAQWETHYGIDEILAAPLTSGEHDDSLLVPKARRFGRGFNMPMRVNQRMAMPVQRVNPQIFSQSQRRHFGSFNPGQRRISQDFFGQRHRANAWHSDRKMSKPFYGAHSWPNPNLWHADRKLSKPFHDTYSRSNLWHGGHNKLQNRMGNQFLGRHHGAGIQAQQIQNGIGNQFQKIQTGYANQPRTTRNDSSSRSQASQTGVWNKVQNGQPLGNKIETTPTNGGLSNLWHGGQNRVQTATSAQPKPQTGAVNQTAQTTQNFAGNKFQTVRTASNNQSRIAQGSNQSQISQITNVNKTQTGQPVGNKVQASKISGSPQAALNKIQTGANSQSSTSQTGKVNQAQTIQNLPGNKVQTIRAASANQSQTVQSQSRAANQSQKVQNGNRNLAQTVQNGGGNHPQTSQIASTTQAQTSQSVGNKVATTKISGSTNDTSAQGGQNRAQTTTTTQSQTSQTGNINQAQASQNFAGNKVETTEPSVQGMRAPKPDSLTAPSSAMFAPSVMPSGTRSNPGNSKPASGPTVLQTGPNTSSSPAVLTSSMTKNLSTADRRALIRDGWNEQLDGGFVKWPTSPNTQAGSSESIVKRGSSVQSTLAAKPDFQTTSLTKTGDWYVSPNHPAVPMPLNAENLGVAPAGSIKKPMWSDQGYQYAAVPVETRDGTRGTQVYRWLNDSSGAQPGPRALQSTVPTGKVSSNSQFSSSTNQSQPGNGQAPSVTSPGTGATGSGASNINVPTETSSIVKPIPAPKLPEPSSLTNTNVRNQVDDPRTRPQVQDNSFLSGLLPTRSTPEDMKWNSPGARSPEGQPNKRILSDGTTMERLSDENTVLSIPYRAFSSSTTSVSLPGYTSAPTLEPIPTVMPDGSRVGPSVGSSAPNTPPISAPKDDTFWSDKYRDTMSSSSPGSTSSPNSGSTTSPGPASASSPGSWNIPGLLPTKSALEEMMWNSPGARSPEGQPNKRVFSDGTTMERRPDGNTVLSVSHNPFPNGFSKP